MALPEIGLVYSRRKMGVKEKQAEQTRVGTAGRLPEGCQVLGVAHGGVEATSESHVHVETHARPCAHLCGGDKHVTRPGLGPL